MDTIYDTVIIGNTLTTYMSAIYTKTSGMNILILKKDSSKDCMFKGYDMIPGVLNMQNERELLSAVEQQAVNLKCTLISIQEIDIQKKDVFVIQTERGTYKSRTVILDTDVYSIEGEGVYASHEGIVYNEAIELCAKGVRLSFAVRDYCSENK